MLAWSRNFLRENFVYRSFFDSTVFVLLAIPCAEEVWIPKAPKIPEYLSRRNRSYPRRNAFD